MIKPGEIQNKARETGVRDQQIEKDYVISWILQGLAKHKQLSEEIVFKGGTVLKKVYFDDYRFSEDLDFTLINNGTSNEEIFEWFEEVFEYIEEEANIPLEIVDDNEHEDGGINFYISYVGQLGGKGANKRIKVDISRTEKLEFEPVVQNVFCN
jgi:predicted nucleotidyltransferase component of viral defense system